MFLWMFCVDVFVLMFCIDVLCWCFVLQVYRYIEMCTYRYMDACMCVDKYTHTCICFYTHIKSATFINVFRHVSFRASKHKPKREEEGCNLQCFLVPCQNCLERVKFHLHLRKKRTFAAPHTSTFPHSHTQTHMYIRHPTHTHTYTHFSYLRHSL